MSNYFDVSNLLLVRLPFFNWQTVRIKRCRIGKEKKNKHTEDNCLDDYQTCLIIFVTVALGESFYPYIKAVIAFIVLLCLFCFLLFSLMQTSIIIFIL